MKVGQINMCTEIYVYTLRNFVFCVESLLYYSWFLSVCRPLQINMWFFVHVSTYFLFHPRCTLPDIVNVILIIFTVFEYIIFKDVTLKCETEIHSTALYQAKGIQFERRTFCSKPAPQCQGALQDVLPTSLMLFHKQFGNLSKTTFYLVNTSFIRLRNMTSNVQVCFIYDK
jgi:hypothetical protein